jgi:hypothetical protein
MFKFLIIEKGGVGGLGGAVELEEGQEILMH